MLQLLVAILYCFVLRFSSCCCVLFSSNIPLYLELMGEGSVSVHGIMIITMGWWRYSYRHVLRPHTATGNNQHFLHLLPSSYNAILGFMPCISVFSLKKKKKKKKEPEKCRIMRLHVLLNHERYVEILVKKTGFRVWVCALGAGHFLPYAKLKCVCIYNLCFLQNIIYVDFL